MSNEKYIEVTGEGEYHEEIEHFISDFTLIVIASTDSKALEEVRALKVAVLEKFIELGLSKNEIIDCGEEVWKPWSKKRKVAKEVKHKLRLRCKNVDLIARAYVGVEHLFESQRYSYNIAQATPEYLEKAEDKLIARRKAIANAKEMAAVMAEEAEITLGPVTQIQELGLVKRSSGAYGDHDYWGDNDRFGMYGGGALAAGGMELEEDTSVSTSNPKRSISVKYRVRFAIGD